MTKDYPVVITPPILTQKIALQMGTFLPHNLEICRDFAQLKWFAKKRRNQLRADWHCRAHTLGGTRENEALTLRLGRSRWGMRRFKVERAPADALPERSAQ
jgi:hypothetical protein